VLTAVPSSAPSKQMEHVRSLSTVSSRLRACVSSSRVDASASFAAALAASSASTCSNDEGPCEFMATGYRGRRQSLYHCRIGFHLRKVHEAATTMIVMHDNSRSADSKQEDMVSSEVTIPRSHNRMCCVGSTPAASVHDQGARGVASK